MLFYALLINEGPGVYGCEKMQAISKTILTCHRSIIEKSCLSKVENIRFPFKNVKKII